MKMRARRSAKGFRELVTPQTLLHRAASAERHELAARFARLENERARLERELAMWAARRRATKDALAKVQEQLAVLRPLFLGRSPKRAVARTRRPPPRVRVSNAAGAAAAPGSRVIPLEY